MKNPQHAAPPPHGAFQLALIGLSPALSMADIYQFLTS